MCVRAAPVCRRPLRALWVCSGGRLCPQLCACVVVSGGGARPIPWGRGPGRGRTPAGPGSTASCHHCRSHRFKRRVRSSKTVRNYDRLVALGPAGAPPRTPGDNTGDRSDRPHTARTVTPTTYRRARCTAPPRRSHFPSRTSTTSSKSPQTFTRWTRCSRSWKKNPRLESQP